MAEAAWLHQRHQLAVCVQVDEDATKQVQEAKRSAEGTVQDLVRARHEISFLEADLEGAKVRVAAGDTWRKRYDQQKGLTERLQTQLDTIQVQWPLPVQGQRCDGILACSCNIINVAACALRVCCLVCMQVSTGLTGL